MYSQLLVKEIYKIHLLKKKSNKEMEHKLEVGAWSQDNYVNYQMIKLGLVFVGNTEDTTSCLLYFLQRCEVAGGWWPVREGL